MKKTILLGEKGMISQKVNKWIFPILGLLYIVIASRKIFEQGISLDTIAHLIIAFIFLIVGIIIYSDTPLTPKIRISNDEIEIKKKTFVRTIKIPWSNIHTIEFDQYLVVFHLKDRVEEFSYGTNAETSIEIKTSIREVAEDKNIRVIGG